MRRKQITISSFGDNTPSDELNHVRKPIVHIMCWDREGGDLQSISFTPAAAGNIAAAIMRAGSNAVSNVDADHEIEWEHDE